MDDTLVLTNKDENWAREKRGEAWVVYFDLLRVSREFEDKKYTFKKIKEQYSSLSSVINTFCEASTPETFQDMDSFYMYHDSMANVKEQCVEMLIKLEGVF